MARRVSIMQALRVVSSLVLIALLVKPSSQFTLGHRTGRTDPTQHGDAISVHGKLAANDNTHIQNSPTSLHQSMTGVSTPASSISPLSLAHAHLASPTKTNSRGEKFESSHRPGNTPSLLQRKPGEEADWKTVGPTTLDAPKRKQVVASRQQTHSSSQSYDTHQSDGLSQQRDIYLTEIVQIQLGQELVQDLDGVRSSDESSKQEVSIKSDSIKRDSIKRDSTNSDSIKSDLTNSEPRASDVVDAGGASNKAVLEEGESQSLQQEARGADTHVSKMVLTVVGSLTAILGVCIMAAIFQCCCRRNRGSSSGEEEEKKEQELDQRSTHSTKSKSPSPPKVLVKPVEQEEEEEHTEKGQSEQDKLLDEDEDLGDFSVVQRETDILRSYRKPPPPKNRARASRVPRALKAVDPKASPSIFQELLDNEEAELSMRSQTPPKTVNGLTSPDAMSPDMHSSMLADIDSTIAAMHDTDHGPSPSPSKTPDRSREPSTEKLLVKKSGSVDTQLKTPNRETSIDKVLMKKSGSDNSQLTTSAKEPSTEKLLVKKSGSDNVQLKTPSKETLPASPSREEFSKVLAQELSRSVSKELLSKPQSKSPTPKSSNTPKCQSAGASPKDVRSKNSSASPSKDSVGSSSSGSRLEASPEEGHTKEPANIFALIDPTAKAGDAGGKSKIPVRAAASPTQPTAPLRLSTGKDKRFPVPSVHGDQMEQLLKSLKTRLKEDDRSSDKVSPEQEPIQDDLDPQSRDRSYSDPTKQREENQKNVQQTHL